LKPSSMSEHKTAARTDCHGGPTPPAPRQANRSLLTGWPPRAVRPCSVTSSGAVTSLATVTAEELPPAGEATARTGRRPISDRQLTVSRPIRGEKAGGLLLPRP
jgi:hypothetical protein